MKFVALTVVALAGSIAGADQKLFDTNTASLSGGFGDRAQGAWTTGFEAPFVAGTLDSQQGWGTSGVNLPWHTVSTLNPHSGSQHTRQVGDSSVAQGTNRLGFSPTVPTAPSTPDTTSWWFFLNEGGGADYDFVGQAPSQGLLTWRVKLNFQGNIFVLDNPGDGLGFSDTGVAFPVGSWFQLAVVTDPTANSLSYYLNGSPIFTGVGGLFAATSVEQFVTLNDNFGSATEFADLDDIGSTIVPAPGAAALLGLGGLLASRRRRA